MSQRILLRKSEKWHWLMIVFNTFLHFPFALNNTHLHILSEHSRPYIQKKFNLFSKTYSLIGGQNLLTNIKSQQLEIPIAERQYCAETAKIRKEASKRFLGREPKQVSVRICQG
jgi:hypothetical protein